MIRATRLSLVLLCLATACTSCKKAESRAASAELTAAKVPAEAPAEVREVEVEGDLPILMVRGREHRVPMVFLAGMCAHPKDYVPSFARAASARGDLVALQGDTACEGESNRKWSSDLTAIDRRIEAAFQAAALPAPKDLVIIGYSQGADRAERLVARWPNKYAKAVLMGSPKEPSPDNLVGAQSVALVAGTNDMAFAKMKGAIADLEGANIRTAFFPIPDASHGEMADNALMEEVLSFVERDGR